MQSNGRQAKWLGMSYNSLQLLLYRSFIHYATPASVRTHGGTYGESTSRNTGLTAHNQKYYSYAAKCLNAAQATLRTARNLHKGTGIRSAYWVFPWKHQAYLVYDVLDV